MKQKLFIKKVNVSKSRARYCLCLFSKERDSRLCRTSTMSNFCFKTDSGKLDSSQTDFEDSPYIGIQRVCIGHDLEPSIYHYAEMLGSPVIKYSEESEAFKLLSCSTGNIFVLKEFEGELYEAVLKSGQNWILGPTAVIEIATTNASVRLKKRPVYCLSMSGLVFYVSCKRNKHLKVQLVELIRKMGGSVRRELEHSTTHMISNTVMAKGYLYAFAFQIPVMTPQWVENSWSHRHLSGFKADCEEMMTYKLKPFAGTYVCFIGFDNNGDTHVNLLEANDGIEVEQNDPRCTHVVVNDCDFVDPQYGFVVTAEWFWESVHHGMRVDEQSYLCNKFPMTERYFTNQEHSTASEESCSFISEEDKESRHLDDSKLGSSDARLHSFLELVQTERNYVNILDIILQIKREVTGDTSSACVILDPTEARIIFGNIHAIANVHKMVLHDIEQILTEWNSQTTVGHIFVKYKDDFINNYPIFASNYEEAQKMVHKCENLKPAFELVLQEYQRKQECGKQHLSELLIRPIQRLGSTLLILREIYKNTSSQHPDHKELEAAIKALEDIMTVMNEDKRRHERVCVIFDVYNLIDNCPADLISSHRSLVLKFSAQELSDQLSGRGDHLVFFLFTDIIEVSKIKSKVLVYSQEKELNSPKKLKLSHGKPYKHITQISLTTVLRLVNIKDDKNTKNAFGLVYRNKYSMKDEMCYFRYLDETPSKEDLISQIVRQISNYTYVLNKDELIMTVSPSSINLKAPELSKTLSSIAVKAQTFICKSLQMTVLGQQSMPRVPVSLDSIRGKSVSCTGLDELKESNKNDKGSQLRTASLKASMLKQWNSENAQ